MSAAEDMSPVIQEETELLFNVPWAHDLPTEIRLFGFGTTETRKGDFIFDERAAADVMARFESDGMDRLPFDVGHLMVKGSENPEGHRAFGWFVPVVKDDFETGGPGLFASQIEWTEAGAQMLSRREFRFFSPAIKYDEQTRRITALINVALTNIPATKNQRPLVLDAQEAETMENKGQENMSVLFECLGVDSEASAVAKVNELQAVLSALDCAPSEAPEKIARLQALADKGAEAQAELARLTKERAAEQRAAKIEALCADGRLLSSQKEFAAMLDDAQFEAFSSTLVANPVITNKVEEPSAGTETLSAEERMVLELLPSLNGEF